MIALVLGFAAALFVTGFFTFILFMHDLENAAVVSFIIFVAVLVVGVGYVPFYAYEAHVCKASATMQELEHDYGVFTGCMVREKGTTRWYPMGQQRFNK
jgi:hypothetical protein